MTKQDLIAVMCFEGEGFTISRVRPETVHHSVLAKNDGPTVLLSSMRMYESRIRSAIFFETQKYPSWPSNWYHQSVAEVADELWNNLALASPIDSVEIVADSGEHAK